MYDIFPSAKELGCAALLLVAGGAALALLIARIVT